VAWCLIRPAETLDVVNGDVDLLLAPGTAAIARHLLAEQGFLRAQRRQFTPGKEVFVRWTGHSLMTLDIHYEVVVNGLVYLDAAGVVERRQYYGAVPRASSPDMMSVLLLHDLVGKGRVQSKYREVLRAEWSTVAGSAAATELTKRGLLDLLPRTVAELHQLLADEAATAALGRRLRQALLRDTGNAVAYWFLRMRRIIRRPRTGVVIALLGPDGSGKSTTLVELHRLIEQVLGWPVVKTYMGPWGHDRFEFMTRWRFPPPQSWTDLLRQREVRLAEGVLHA
jgi:hypothetical protein